METEEIENWKDLEVKPFQGAEFNPQTSFFSPYSGTILFTALLEYLAENEYEEPEVDLNSFKVMFWL